METIKLITCENLQKANIIKGRLINEGIEAFTTNENSATLLPHLNGMLGSGIQIYVNKESYDQAISIINENTATDKVTCPYCGSENVVFNLGAHKTRKIVTIILSLLVFIPFGNIKNKSYCKNCKSEF